MKKLLALLAVGFALTVNAQTNEPPAVPGTEGFESILSSLSTISNWVIAPYYTRAPNAPTKDGGGVLLLYNINNYIGAGAGVDWLGHFNMFSGNATLRYTFHPLQWMGSDWAKNISATPFGIAGLGVPIGGAHGENGGAATIAGVGVSLIVFSTEKFDFGGGYASTQWTGTGDADGFHHQIFARISLRF